MGSFKRISVQKVVSACPPPVPEAELVDFSVKSDVAIFRKQDDQGTHLWLVRPGADTRMIVETDTFLKEVVEGQARVIKYRSMDGTELNGWLLLPPDFQAGRRYPLVTRAYPGTVVGDSPSFALDEDARLLAAHGYCLLIPSMPLKRAGESQDPYLELTKGVIPAIDKVIDMGIADPKRLAVMGVSFGVTALSA